MRNRTAARWGMEGRDPVVKAIGTKPWSFAILYLAVSLAVEIVLIVVFRLRVPQDNRILAPIVLTVPPALTTWIAGYRSPAKLAALTLITALLTLVVTIIVTRITGKNVGLTEPIISRSVAGFLAMAIAGRLVGNPSAEDDVTRRRRG